MYIARSPSAREIERELIVDRPVSPWFVALIGVHIPLAVLITYFSPLAALHAGGVIAAALGLAAFGTRIAPVVYLGGYITGAEVFWRMTNNRLPWELGKYSIILVCVTAILRLRGLRGLMWPALGIALYLPSTAVTIADMTADEARNQIAFNLSGPLALVLCAQFFALVRLTPGEVRRTLIAVIAPVVGLATVEFYRIA